jgi:glycosyltransferase involved in cell wall biosynthesis
MVPGVGVARVVVYDPDGVNPYGRELAAQLADRYDVTAVIAADAPWRPPGVRSLAVLPRNRAASAWSQALRLLRGWLTVLALAARDAQWVVVWSRRDAAVLRLVARLRRLHLVVHNPGPRDTLPPALKAAAATRVVHSAALAAGDATVCAHPLYTHWLAAFRTSVPDHDGTRLLLLGHPRPDKGDDVLPALAAALPDDVTLVFCGKRAAPSLPVRIEDRTSGDFVSDADLAAALLSCDALLAPYTGATQSGTAALAVTAGLPVVGFDSGAIREMAGSAGLVPPGDVAALARVAAAAKTLPRPVTDPGAALRDWTAVLG